MLRVMFQAGRACNIAECKFPVYNLPMCLFQELYCVRSDLGNLLKALGRLDEAKVCSVAKHGGLFDAFPDYHASHLQHQSLVLSHSVMPPLLSTCPMP